MGENNFYQTPNADIIPKSKFELFGGWLRFYQVLNILSIAMAALAFGLVIVFTAMGEYQPHEYVDTFSAFVEFLPELIISIIVVKMIKKREPEVPTKLVEYLGYYVAITFCVYIVMYILHQKEVLLEKPTSFWGSVIFYLIWKSYFAKSKRVSVYYGANAN